MNQLEAINKILGMAGEPPVDSVDTEGLTSVSFALSELQSASQRIQSARVFATRRTVKVVPDSEGKLRLSELTLFVDRAITNEGDVLVFYNGNLIAEDGTDVFGPNVYADVIVHTGRNFEYLPYYVQDYIVAEAAYEFIKVRLGAPDLVNTVFRRREEARRQFNRLEVLHGRPSSLDNPTVLNILGRRSNPRRRY